MTWSDCLCRLAPAGRNVGDGVTGRTFCGTCTGCGQRLKFRTAALATQRKESGNDFRALSRVEFSVNGRRRVVLDPEPETSLLDWLEGQPDLRGTKRMCQEGGCGACAVALTRKDRSSGCTVTTAVNSVRATVLVYR